MGNEMSRLIFHFLYSTNATIHVMYILDLIIIYLVPSETKKEKCMHFSCGHSYGREGVKGNHSLSALMDRII